MELEALVGFGTVGIGSAASHQRKPGARVAADQMRPSRLE